MESLPKATLALLHVFEKLASPPFAPALTCFSSPTQINHTQHWTTKMPRGGASAQRGHSAQ